MTATQIKTARRNAIRALKAGDVVRVVRVGQSFAGPGTGEVVATAAVVKVLAGAVRVAWSERGGETTDFTRDAGKPVGNRSWIGYPVIDVAGAPTVGPAF